MRPPNIPHQVRGLWNGNTLTLENQGVPEFIHIYIYNLYRMGTHETKKIIGLRCVKEIRTYASVTCPHSIVCPGVMNKINVGSTVSHGFPFYSLWRVLRLSANLYRLILFSSYRGVPSLWEVMGSHFIEGPVGGSCRPPFYIYTTGTYDPPTQSTRGSYIYIHTYTSLLCPQLPICNVFFVGWVPLNPIYIYVMYVYKCNVM